MPLFVLDVKRGQLGQGETKCGQCSVAGFYILWACRYSCLGELAMRGVMPLASGHKENRRKMQREEEELVNARWLD